MYLDLEQGRRSNVSSLKNATNGGKRSWNAHKNGKER
jgi:hypothetical protein